MTKSAGLTVEEQMQLREAYARRAPAERLRAYIVYMNKDYSLQWFQRLILDKCQALYDGTLDKDRLMVFLPPQHSKSTIISKAFPAWALGKNPDLKIVACSYSATLAEQFSRAVQQQIDSPEYQAVFPDTFLNGSHGHTEYRKGYQRNVDNFDTVGHRGFYKAVGVGGSLTGTPADIAIIDDPVKNREEAFSVTYREKTWDWYNSVLLTRLHNNSKQLFVMTRWHQDDLAGRILRHEAEKWEVVSIPALCEVDGDGELGSGRHVGDALWEGMHSKGSLLESQARTPSIFSALYQQHPVIEGGNIVKREWFDIISAGEFKARHHREPIRFFLDTAYSKRDERKDNDPSGILGACKIKDDIYIIHAHRMWLEMPELLRFLPEYIKQQSGDGNSILYVEPKANGKSVCQMLKRETDMNVRELKPPKDNKEVRFRVASPTIEAGRVHLVEGAWNVDFLNEVCEFPASAHDEFVDILGYAIDRLENGSNLDPETLARISRMSFT